MNEEAVEPQETMDVMIDQVEDVQHDQVDDQPQKTMVPLSVAQKLREQKRELELELQWERQRNTQVQSQKPQEDDQSKYESVTREELSRSQAEIVRIVQEKEWIRKNPEKFERIEQQLPQFLKQRPNLRSAIADATNRYEEAYELMDKLTVNQQKQLARSAVPVKKEAPNSPGSVPKAAALSDAVDVMNMNDSEYQAWRQSKKRR